MTNIKAPLWRQIQKKNFFKWESLLEFLELKHEQLDKLLMKPKFPLNLPLRLAEKIQKGTLNDPILQQFVPLNKETVIQEGFLSDPVDDKRFRKSSKLLHKYQGRALLLCTSACVMHCRYCFRQNFPYESQVKGFSEEIEQLRLDSEISEVLLSGGDPLSLDNKVLEGLIEQIASIPHIRRLRFHTRFPIGIPERIDEEFIRILENTRLQVVFVVHVNHSSELDEDIFNALKKLQKLGIPVLTQTVFLKDVNDNYETLYQLFTKLVDKGIIPYYLHQLDKVQGAAHFEVSVEKGKNLIEELRKTLPGYALPRFVQENAGECSKSPL